MYVHVQRLRHVGEPREGQLRRQPVLAEGRAVRLDRRHPYRPLTVDHRQPSFDEVVRPKAPHLLALELKSREHAPWPHEQVQHHP